MNASSTWLQMLTRWGWLSLALLALLCPAALGQQVVPGPPALPGQAVAPVTPAAGGPDFIHLSFISVDQLAYTQHPYNQILDDTDFGKSGQSGSYVVGSSASDAAVGFFDRALHALPPFGIQAGWRLDLPFPRAVTAGFDYFKVIQTDEQAIEVEGPVEKPRISTYSYYYNTVFRLYVFDPTAGGLNFFVGVGLGVLDGIMISKVTRDDPEVFTGFKQTPAGMRHFGLEVLGRPFGFRYELISVNTDEVELESNPYPGQSAVTTIDFSGTLIRLSAIYRFGGR